VVANKKEVGKRFLVGLLIRKQRSVGQWLVSVSLSVQKKFDYTGLIFIDAEAKVNGAYYHEVFPEIPSQRSLLVIRQGSIESQLTRHVRLLPGINISRISVLTLSNRGGSEIFTANLLMLVEEF